MAKRTKKGNVTAEERKRSGSKGGKFPVFDRKSALAAIKLRHHGKGISASAVLAKVSRWANAHDDELVKAKVKAAREKDKKK